MGIIEELQVYLKLQNSKYNKQYLNALIKNMHFCWKKLFTTVLYTDFSILITSKEASDPDSKIVQLLLYIYSMQTFIVRELNMATRKKHYDKIGTFGPFALTLSRILSAVE